MPDIEIPDRVIKQLQTILGRFDLTSSDRFERSSAETPRARDEVIARYGKAFAPENINSLSPDVFKSFLDFKNNRHWEGLHRRKTELVKDMARLRRALGLIVDENLPISERFDQVRSGDAKVAFLGPAIMTAVLHVVYPDRYGVWNHTSETAIKLLGLWPRLPKDATFGQTYVALNEVFRTAAMRLQLDLWTMDIVWWGVARGKAESANDDEVVGVVEEATQLIASDAAMHAFGLESHLQEFIEDNWDHTPLGREWSLHEEDGEVVGSLYNTGEVGVMDMLAKHRSERRWLVIELKRNQTSDSTVGQLLRYMAWVRHNLAKGEQVEGLVICREIDRKLQYALDALPMVRCMNYEVNFCLKDAPKV